MVIDRRQDIERFFEALAQRRGAARAAEGDIDGMVAASRPTVGAGPQA